ncbi:MAG: hypothetical protein IJI45_18300 [Anaerolineaceae bacterium]|nr:hypothetical protein [Anaerolineaceae bacterium]
MPSIKVPKVGGGEAEFVYGSSGGGATVKVATASVSSNSTSIEFTVDAQPKAFACMLDQQCSLGSTRYVIAVTYDGTHAYGTWGYRSGSSGTCYYSNTYFTVTYSNGKVTIKTSSSTNGGYFRSGYTYRMIYAY